MDGRPHRVSLGMADRIGAVVLAVLAAYLSSELSYRKWGYTAAGNAERVGEVREQLAAMRRHEEEELRRLNKLYIAAHQRMNSVVIKEADARAKVAHASGLLETTLRWREETDQRLATIEKTLASAKRTVEHVDRKVEQVRPALAPQPWWAFWR